MKKIKLEQYRIDVFFTKDLDEFNEKSGATDLTKTVAGCCHRNEDTRQILIGIFDNSLGTLSHEIFHAVLDISEMIESGVNRETNEHCAYLTCFLMEKLLGLGAIDFTKKCF